VATPFLVVVAIALAAINLRPALSSVSAELSDIRADLGLSGLGAGSLTTLPVICMGVFATLAVRLARRLGLERTMAIATATIGVATLVRGLAPSAAGFILATVAIGIAIAVGQALVPAVVKAYFARKPGGPTGVFALWVNVGALAGAALTVPVATLLNDQWRAGLAVWALLALPACVIWIRLARREGVPMRPSPAGERGAHRGFKPGLAVRVTALMATLSTTFYVPVAWLTVVFEDAGVAEGSAVTLFSLFVAVQIPTAVVAGSLGRSPLTRGRLLAAMLAVTALGFVGAGIAASAAPALWAILIGLGVGATFPLGWTLPVDHTPTPASAATLTGVALTGGYLVAAIGPALAGLLRDATGDLTVPFMLVAAVTFVAVPLAWRLAGHASEESD